MTAPDLVALNASMSTRILDESATPYSEGAYVLRVVHTTGRRSGQRRTVPLGVVQLDGLHYLVSPDRRRGWVRNLDSDPACTLATADGTEDRTAVPASPGTAATVVSTYLQVMRDVPWAMRAFPVSPDASLDEITERLDTIGVLRLDPR
jgi:deazaflavin-dependent oxidoreductase (nitroreductase family)